MRIPVFFSFCTAMLALSGCGESVEQATDALNQELRSRFIRTATAQCIEEAGKNTALSEEELPIVCGCTAEAMLDHASFENLPQLLSDKPDAELTAAVSRATVECVGKAMNLRPASAAW